MEKANNTRQDRTVIIIVSDLIVMSLIFRVN